MSKISAFIKRWKESGGSEQANSQLFLAELCDILDLKHPDPAKSTNEKISIPLKESSISSKGNGQNELKRLDSFKSA